MNEEAFFKMAGKWARPILILLIMYLLYIFAIGNKLSTGLYSLSLGDILIALISIVAEIRLLAWLFTGSDGAGYKSWGELGVSLLGMVICLGTLLAIYIYRENTWFSYYLFGGFLILFVVGYLLYDWWIHQR